MTLLWFCTFDSLLEIGKPESKTSRLAIL